MLLIEQGSVKIKFCLNHKFLNSLFLKWHHLKLSFEKKEVIISLECVRKLPLQVKRHLNDIFRSCQENIKLTVVFKSPNRLRNAFRGKEQIISFQRTEYTQEY